MRIVGIVLGLLVTLAGCVQRGPYGRSDSLYKQDCRGGWVECGYDSARNHTDGNPN
jgi:hypothetical protein